MGQDGGWVSKQLRSFFRDDRSDCNAARLLPGAWPERQFCHQQRRAERPHHPAALANGLNEKALIARLADERGYTVNPDIVTSHWMFLKLKLTLERVQLRGSNAGSSVKTVLKAGWDMVLSAIRSPELKPLKKLQHVAWALSVAFLPWRVAQRAVRVAFETAPTRKVSYALRRW